jgi:hypothetical protein
MPSLQLAQLLEVEADKYGATIALDLTPFRAR